MRAKLAVIAIGGNALCPDSGHTGVDKQYGKVEEAARHIVRMMRRGWNVLVSHGNGPQVGLAMRRSELAREELPPVPMDYAGADVQGAVGYMFCKALRNAFRREGLPGEPVAVVTQTLVDASDPAFAAPSKPVGDWFAREQAEKLAREHGWHIVEDSGRGWRRAVPSPEPVAIVEREAIARMLASGLTVVALGGGGIPVIQSPSGELSGVEAVIDKDMSASLLARQLRAEMLILPTAVEKLAIRFGRPDQRTLDSLTVAEAETYLAAGEFPPGSMGPKVRALAAFVRAGGGAGLITTPQNLGEAVCGKAGTRLVP